MTIRTNHARLDARRATLLFISSLFMSSLRLSFRLRLTALLAASIIACGGGAFGQTPSTRTPAKTTARPESAQNTAQQSTTTSGSQNSQSPQSSQNVPPSALQNTAQTQGNPQQGITRNAGTSGKDVIVATSEGTDFWVCFQRNFTEPERDPVSGRIAQRDVIDLQLFIAASEDCKATIEIDGLLFKREIAVRGGSVVNVRIDSSAQIRSSETIERLAIHVTATKPVSVYGLNHRFMTTDTYLGLPTTALGYEYRIMSYEKLRDDQQLLSQFAVIATEDSTFVTINPTTPTTKGRPRGVPFSVLLKRGDVYNVVAGPGRRNGKADLTGTLVQSNKKIAVFGSHSGAYIPNNELPGCNHLVEQMPPVTYWGRHYYVGMLAGCTRSVYRVLAAEGSTRVFANGKLVATLGAGEFYEDDNVTTNIQITADKRILVSQYSIGFKNGQGTDLKDSVGDPMMILITPTQQFLKKYRIATPTRGQWHHYFNLVVPRAAMLSMKLDGKPLDAKIFKPFADSRYMFAQLEVVYGTHTIECREPFGLYSYGFGYDEDNYDAYGNMGGQAFTEWRTLPDTLAPTSSFQPQQLGAKVIFHDDRDNDTGLKSFRILRNDGMSLTEPQFSAGAPLAFVLAYPRAAQDNSSALVEMTDVQGNRALFTLCYSTDGTTPVGTFSVVDGDVPACPKPSSWFAGVYGSLSYTSHRASFGALGGITTPGVFGDAGGAGIQFTGGGAVIGRKLNPYLALTARIGVEQYPGRIEAVDSVTTPFRDSTRNFQISQLQQGSAVRLRGVYASLALGAEWSFNPYVYALAGAKAAVLVSNSLEFTRYIVSPANVSYANQNREETKFSGSFGSLQTVIPSVYAGLGGVYPFNSFSVFAEAVYSSAFGSIISDGSWLVSQFTVQAGVRVRL